MYFSKNLQLLRRRRGRSQADLSSLLQMKRTSLSGYELGTSFPNYETLILISDFFRISIDKLLKVDLSSISELQLSEMEKGHDIDLTGSRLRVLATTVDPYNDDNNIFDADGTWVAGPPVVQPVVVIGGEGWAYDATAGKFWANTNTLGENDW